MQNLTFHAVKGRESKRNRAHSVALPYIEGISVNRLGQRLKNRVRHIVGFIYPGENLVVAAFQHAKHLVDHRKVTIHIRRTFDRAHIRQILHRVGQLLIGQYLKVLRLRKAGQFHFRKHLVGKPTAAAGLLGRFAGGFRLHRNTHHKGNISNLCAFPHTVVDTEVIDSVLIRRSESAGTFAHILQVATVEIMLVGKLLFVMLNVGRHHGKPCRHIVVFITES